MAGVVISSLQSRGSTGCNRVPRPVARQAATPLRTIRQKGTSEPRRLASSSRSSKVSGPSPHIWANAQRTAAPSALPPARPAAMGIFFSMSTVIRSHLPGWKRWCISRAAW